MKIEYQKMKPSLPITVCIITVTIFSLLLGPIPSAAQAVPDDAGTKIDAYISQVQEVVPIPGVAVAVVNSRGFVYTQGYGRAAPGRLVTPQTPFWIASLSKPFTALAVRQLVNTGKLDLDATVQEYIPWFTLADPQAAAKIKVSHLLNHSSGIPGAAGGQVYFDASEKDTREDVIRELKEVMPNPVGQMEYSNYNYILLGYLIELVSGQSFEAYMQEHVLDPLEMEHTHFSAQAAKMDGGVSGYRLLFGLPVPWDEPYKPSMQSSGYIISSVEDMGRLAMLYLNDGKSGSTYLPGTEPPTQDGYYDIYWKWIGGPARKSTPEHGGAMRTNSSAIRIYPDRDLAVVVLMNCRPDGVFKNLNATTVLDNVAAILFGSKPNPPNVQGWRSAVNQVNQQTGIFLALFLVSFGLTLVWRKRLLHLEWLRYAAAVLAVLEIGLAIYGIVGTPLLNQASWDILLKIAPDIYGGTLVLGGLFAVSAGLKIVTLVRARREQVAQEVYAV